MGERRKQGETSESMSGRRVEVGEHIHNFVSFLIKYFIAARHEKCGQQKNTCHDCWGVVARHRGFGSAQGLGGAVEGPIEFLQYLEVFFRRSRKTG